MLLNETEYWTLLRRDLSTFIERCFRELNPEQEYFPNWHINLIAGALEDCLTGKTKRLIINVPPRSLKSICISVAFVAWFLGHRPSAEMICVSYGQDLANKHSLDCRRIMVSQWYQ